LSYGPCPRPSFGRGANNVKRKNKAKLKCTSEIVMNYQDVSKEIVFVYPVERKNG
jgi:hypothetical protein